MSKLIKNTKEYEELAEEIYNKIKDFTDPNYEKLIKKSIRDVNHFQLARYYKIFEEDENKYITFLTNKPQINYSREQNNFCETVDHKEYIINTYAITKYGITGINNTLRCEGIRILLITTEDKSFIKNINIKVAQLYGIFDENLDSVVKTLKIELKSFMKEIKEKSSKNVYIDTISITALNNTNVPFLLSDIIYYFKDEYSKEYGMDFYSLPSDKQQEIRKQLINKTIEEKGDDNHGSIKNN